MTNDIEYISTVMFISGLSKWESSKESDCNAGDTGSVLGWEDALEEGMAIHSSTLAWRIPWTEEPGRLQSMGSQRVRHNWSDWAHTHRLFATRMSFRWSVCSNLLSVHFLITLWTWNSHPHFFLSSSPPMRAALTLHFPHYNHRFFLGIPPSAKTGLVNFTLCGMYYASILSLLTVKLYFHIGLLCQTSTPKILTWVPQGYCSSICLPVTWPISVAKRLNGNWTWLSAEWSIFKGLNVGCWEDFRTGSSGGADGKCVSMFRMKGMIYFHRFPDLKKYLGTSLVV